MSLSRVAKALDPERVRQGATVRALREARGLTVDQLAKRVTLPSGEPMSRAYLSNVEAGRKRLTPVLAVRIADVLAVSPVALLRPDHLAEPVLA